jgi:hypothetical protein
LTRTLLERGQNPFIVLAVGEAVFLDNPRLVWRLDLKLNEFVAGSPHRDVNVDWAASLGLVRNEAPACGREVVHNPARSDDVVQLQMSFVVWVLPGVFAHRTLGLSPQLVENLFEEPVLLRAVQPLP